MVTISATYMLDASRMEQRAVGGDQRGVDQGADDRTGENVAEMTAGHGDGGEQLTHDI